jgi:hypothetical protein
MKKIFFFLFLITQLHAASDSATALLTNLSGNDILLSENFCALTTDATLVSQGESKHIRIGIGTNPAFIYTSDVPNFLEKFKDRLKDKELKNTYIAGLFIESAAQGFFQVADKDEVVNGDVVTILPENRIRIERGQLDFTAIMRSNDYERIKMLTAYQRIEHSLFPTTKKDLNESNLLDVYLSKELEDALEEIAAEV